MGIVGQCLDDVRAGVNEIAMELCDDLRMFEHDLGHESAGLKVAAALKLEHVAFGANHRALVETLQQRRSRDSGHGDLELGGRRNYGTFSRRLTNAEAFETLSRDAAPLRGDAGAAYRFALAEESWRRWLSSCTTFRPSASGRSSTCRLSASRWA